MLADRDGRTSSSPKGSFIRFLSSVLDVLSNAQDKDESSHELGIERSHRAFERRPGVLLHFRRSSADSIWCRVGGGHGLSPEDGKLSHGVGFPKH
jgi:hypothetical protein